MRFYLGTHKVGWLANTSVPLFVSHRQAKARKTPLVASCDWALDSGGYSELSQYGEWRTGVSEYVDAVARYQSWGHLQWAAPQDWMTEPWVLQKTGKPLAEHLERTVQSYLDLSVTGLPFIPVVQGQTIDDYHRCADMYESAGVDLSAVQTVGVGSVCRREGTKEAEAIFRELAARGMRLHGFGVKVSGLRRYADVMTSADSMAWSFGARWEANKVRSTGQEWECPWGESHKSCANCKPYAMRWRSSVVDACEWANLTTAA